MTPRQARATWSGALWFHAGYCRAGELDTARAPRVGAAGERRWPSRRWATVARAPFTVESLLAEVRTSLRDRRRWRRRLRQSDDFREPLARPARRTGDRSGADLARPLADASPSAAAAAGARFRWRVTLRRPGRRRRADRDAAGRDRRAAHRHDHPARPARRRPGAARPARLGAAAARAPAGARSRATSRRGSSSPSRAARLRRRRSRPRRHPRVRRAQPQGMPVGDVVRLPFRGIRRALQRAELHRLAGAVRHASRLRLPPARARAAAAPQPAPAVGAEVAGSPAFAQHGARRLSRRPDRRHPSRSAGGARIGQQPRRASALGAQRSGRPAVHRPLPRRALRALPQRAGDAIRIRGYASRAACTRVSSTSSSPTPSGPPQACYAQLGSCCSPSRRSRRCRVRQPRAPAGATAATSTRSPNSASTPPPNVPVSPRTPVISPSPTRCRDITQQSPLRARRRRRRGFRPKRSRWSRPYAIWSKRR